MKAADKAYNILRNKIVGGDYLPGVRVTELDVASVVGVSRTPVREAMRRLQVEGLLTVVANQGAMVTDWDAREAADIFEMRLMLEGYAARLAAQNASAEQVEQLRTLAEAQATASQHKKRGYLHRIASLNSQFHRCLFESTGSARLQTTLTTLTSAPLVLQTFRDYEDKDIIRSANHHLELVDAIEVGDADWAASVMHSHILAAKSRFELKHAELNNLSD